MSAEYTAPNRVYGGAKPCHLEGVTLEAASGPWDIMRCPLVVGEAVSTCHIIHAFEIGEEILEGFEMGQNVSDLHAPLVVCA